MTWIKTIPLTEADDELRRAVEGQRFLYPKEYSEPVHPDDAGGAIYRRIPHLDPGRVVPRLRNLRRADVARAAVEPPPA